ncbi:MAG: hypothetical protein ACFB4J_18710 [Elainellaceae cyanobacterium]
MTEFEDGFPEPRFDFGQQVQEPSGQRGYICGRIYYSDDQQWHYAITFDEQKVLPNEIWYIENELIFLER